MAEFQKLKKLSPKHLRVCMYIARGAEVASVARKFGYALPSLMRLLNDPLIKKQIDKYIHTIEERSLKVLDDALIPLHDNLRKFSDEIVRIVTDAKSTDGNKIRAAELGFNLVKPSSTKDDAGKKRQPELRIRIDRGEPDLKVIEGGGG